MTRDRVGLVGLALVVLSLLAAVVGPSVAPYDPAEIHPGARLAAPGALYFLGTDELGRDLLTRTLYGTRVSLQVGLVAVTVASALGILIGLLSGYFRGSLDTVFMRAMDILFAFPTILLALFLVAVLGPDLQNLIAAITVVYVPAFARITRGSTLVIGAESYVEAARSIGATHARIMLQHILPNVTAPLVVQYTISLAYAILVEASLSFLGLGVQPPMASLGAMLSTGKPYVEISPWLSLVPGLAIMLTVLGFNLLGDGMRDALDPRLRSREG